MPIYQTKNVSENLKVGIWRITETDDELVKTIENKGISIENKPVSQNKSRITQWLAVRVLLSHFFDNTTIRYDELGKPSLSNGWCISISHTKEFIAIIINKDDSCGIDIEKISEKVERIKHKFLNPLDLKNVSSLQDLAIYWGAKEALYKYYGKKEVLFIENLFISNFSADRNNFIGAIEIQNYSKEIDMEYEIIEDHVLVYTV